MLYEDIPLTIDDQKELEQLRRFKRIVEVMMFHQQNFFATKEGHHKKRAIEGEKRVKLFNQGYQIKEDLTIDSECQLSFVGAGEKDFNFYCDLLSQLCFEVVDIVLKSDYKDKEEQSEHLCKRINSIIKSHFKIGDLLPFEVVYNDTLRSSFDFDGCEV